MAGQRVVQVAAAVIMDAAGRVLVAQRPPDRHQGGLWEFPGGKVEAGETPRAALDRELAEELGIVVEQARPLIRVRHGYPDKAVQLDVWQVDVFAGRPHGREGQPFAWVAPDDLCRRDFPVANLPIVNAARLPPVYLVTPEPENTAVFLARLEALLAAGVKLVQLRAKTLEEAAYMALARQMVAVCETAGACLLLNAPPARVAEVGAAGVHLTAQRLMALDERPLPAGLWVAASCHNPEELAHACRIGVDFVVLAPVLATASHPKARPLDWAELHRLTEQATVPVYALGGMKPDYLATAWAHGAQGIAAISGLWDEELKV